MQIREFSKPVTAEALNESLAKTFGYKINLEQFTDVQLEDARNKLRTKLSQMELGESFDTVNESPEYQKTRMFLDCINQELTEREDGKVYEGEEEEEEESADDKKAEKKANLRKKVHAESIVHKAVANKVPTNWIKSAITRIAEGTVDEDELVSELMTRYDLSEGRATNIVYLAEGEEDKAATIMATKDMVERITGWIEDVANLKAEKLLELLDSIRETQGSDTASKYEQAVKPALESIYAALEQSRQGLQTALALVSGKEAPMMGSSDLGMPGNAGGGEELPPVPGEEAGLGAPAAPGEEELPPLPGEEGRMKRESVEYSRKLGLMLAQSKKK